MANYARESASNEFNDITKMYNLALDACPNFEDAHYYLAVHFDKAEAVKKSANTSNNVTMHLSYRFIYYIIVHIKLGFLYNYRTGVKLGRKLLLVTAWDCVMVRNFYTMLCRGC